MINLMDMQRFRITYAKEFVQLFFCEGVWLFVGYQSELDQRLCDSPRDFYSSINQRFREIVSMRSNSRIFQRWFKKNNKQVGSCTFKIKSVTNTYYATTGQCTHYPRRALRTIDSSLPRHGPPSFAKVLLWEAMARWLNRVSKFLHRPMARWDDRTP